MKNENLEDCLNDRLDELLNRQETQLITLQQMSSKHGTLLRNYPSYYSPPHKIIDILDELLNRENELLLEYTSFQSYFLPPYLNQEGMFNELIINKSEQLKLLNEISPCFENDRIVFLEDGYKLEKIISGLTYPTVITFDDRDNMYIPEAGDAYGAKPEEGRILKFTADDEISAIAGGFNGLVTGLTSHEGDFYIAEGGTGKKASTGCGKIKKYL